MNFWALIRRWLVPGASIEQYHPHVPLIDEQIAEMKRLYAHGGWTQRDLAERYSVSQSTVSRVLGGHRRSEG